MGLMRWVRSRFNRPVSAIDTVRAVPSGSVLIQPGEEYWGHDDSKYSPSEYLEYISTSNNVYTCVTKRANALSQLPITIYKGKRKDTRKEVETGSLRNLLDSVNPWMTFDRLLNITEQYLCLTGEAFWFLERGKSGKLMPQEIWPVRPDLVRIVPDPVNFIRGFLIYPEGGGPPVAYTKDEVIWFPYPNPQDPYSGLAPLAAARLAADTASAAMKSNYDIFSHGTRVGGVVSPPDNASMLTTEQLKELQRIFDGRRAQDKTHTLAFLAYAVKFQQWTMTPKDAEFLGALDLTLEEIARAFGIAPDLLGGSKRTYQNAPEARYAFWADTMSSEARFIQSIITERLVPMFGDEADSVEFDFNDVDALRENEDAKWKREMEQIGASAITINEWRSDKGMTSVPWGDVTWMPFNLTPVSDDSGMAPVQEVPSGTVTTDMPPEEQPRMLRKLADIFQLPAPQIDTRTHQVPAYGSPEHVRLMDRSDRERVEYERLVDAAVSKLFRSQRQSVIAKLTSERSTRSAVDVAANPFDKATWIRTFRNSMRPVTTTIVDKAGASAMEQLGSGFAGSFEVSDPNVIRAIERQVQRFAKEVNDTTWTVLKSSLSEGLDAGETIDELAARVRETMGDRIRSSGETIARTETLVAQTTGSHASWVQSGVVSHVAWESALDERTRLSHFEAHGQIVALGEDFQVGGCSGPGPGLIDCPEESISCRCVTLPIIEGMASDL